MSNTETPTERRESGNRGMWLILAIIAVVAIVALVVYMSGNNAEDTPAEAAAEVTTNIDAGAAGEAVENAAAATGEAAQGAAAATADAARDAANATQNAAEDARN